MKLYHYYFYDINGNRVENSQQSNGSIQQGKLKAWQIKNIESSLTEKHGIKCIVKLTKIESL